MLAVCKVELSFSFLQIVFEEACDKMKSTLIAGPKFLDLFEVAVVEGIHQSIRGLVIQSTVSMKAILLKMTIIGYDPRLIVEFSLPLHEIFLPVPEEAELII
jgi:hypothetical protein